MKRTNNIGLVASGIIVLMLILSSCFKQDKKIVLPPPGQTQVATVSMGAGYANEVFFDFTNGSVLTNQFAAWDLAFESSPAGYHVWVSGGKGMLAANMNTNNFYSITDTLGAYWRWDEASWSPDSTAIGNWVSFIPNQYSHAATSTLRIGGNQSFSNGDVFIIDRSASYPDSTRFYKVVFESVSQTAYTLKWATLNNSYVDSVVLQKNPNENYTYFTFDNGGGPIVMEPMKNTWEILFTRYRHIFYSYTPPIPYLVTGALTNNISGVRTALDSIEPYSLIDYNYAKNLMLSSNREVMGYDWKVYNQRQGVYTMKANYSYIILDTKGFYWKLKYLGFYNSQGQEGYPQFEYQRL